MPASSTACGSARRSVSLQEQRHGRSGGETEGGPDRSVSHDRHRRCVLDGRLHRQPAGNLRSGRQVRRAGDGRRFARRRLHGLAGTRHARIPRRDGSHRHHHRHTGQSARRRQRRLHQRSPRADRPAAPTFATLPVLQFRRSADRRRLDQGDRSVAGIDRTARQAGTRTRDSFGRRSRRSATMCFRASTRSSRSCSTTPRWPAERPTRCWRKGSM